MCCVGAYRHYMEQPKVPIDEDWEILLPDADRDDTWEADDSQRKRFYVGKSAFEKRDPVSGRVTSLRIFSGRIRLLEPPRRFQVALTVRSPIRWDSFSASSPIETLSFFLNIIISFFLFL